MPRLEEVLLPPDERSPAAHPPEIRSSQTPHSPGAHDSPSPQDQHLQLRQGDVERIPVHGDVDGEGTVPTTRGSPFKRGKLPHTGKPFLPKGKTAIAAPFYPEPLAEEITPFSLSFLDLRKHVPRELLESMLAHFEVHHFSGISAQEFIQMARMAGDGTGGGG